MLLSASASISARGYGLPKDALTPVDITALREELTAKPVNAMMGGEGPGGGEGFPCYLESSSKIYVPRAFGLERYGVPAKVTLPDGADIAVPFSGRLREDTQQPVCDAFLAAARDPARLGGVINLACGMGKTVCGLYVVSRLAKKTIIVAHKEFLVNQWAERIRQFLPSARLGFIKGKVCDVIDKDVVVASLQSLVVGTGTKKYPVLDRIATDPTQAFGLLIGDETHHLAACVFKRIFTALPTKRTLGLSATLERKDGLTKVLFWYLGRVVNQVPKAPAAVANGGAPGVVAQIRPFSAADAAYCREEKLFFRGEQKPNVSRMINNICAFLPRTRHVVDTILNLIQDEPNRRILVLSDRRRHLEDMRAMLAESPAVPRAEVGLVVGGTKREVLQENEKNCKILLGTYAYVSEGFDVQSLNTLVLASPKSDVIQVCGRILRCPADQRTVVPTIIDIVDRFSLFEFQAVKRMRYYRSQGFDVQKIPSHSTTTTTTTTTPKPK